MTDGADTLFGRGGRLARDMAAEDWSTTPLGPPEGWPAALRSVVRVLLTSRFAMWMAWGPELTVLYNDAYQRDTLQTKHPWALGRPAREVWAEIWPDIAPRIESVLATGVATWDEDLQLFLERSGYPEETFHTFSYSPLAGEDGRVEGMLCVVTENTDRVLSERRMATLRDLGTALAATSTRNEVLGAVRIQLGADPRDLPFVLTYLVGHPEDPASPARLVAAVGTEGYAGPAVPAELPAGDGGAWPTARARAGHRELVDGLDARFGSLPTGPWSRPPCEAVVVPLTGAGAGEATGFLVVGVNPHRAFDERFGDFLDLLAAQISSGLVNAGSYEAERRRAEALTELDRAKTDFFSNVSHELRTPLTLILGPVEDLRAADDVDPVRWRAELEVVHRNGLRLGRLVNSLLDVSRVQAGRVQTRFEPVDLGAVTGELASVFRSAMERAGLEYVVDTPTLPTPVHLDRESWEKVVLNLLSNALKYTLTGSVTVRVRLAEGAAVLDVTDTGVGIPADELPRLFERFHRVRGTRGRSGEGSGIGLALVQELVALHGGEVTATSTPGRGATFTVTLPTGRAHLPADQVRDDPDAAPAAEVATVAEPFLAEALRWLPDATEGAVPGDREVPTTAPVDGAGSGHVLVADDNADMRSYLARLLAPQYAVTVAADGDEALAAALADPPDLVVSDVMMPGRSGTELLAALRAEPRTARVPVLLLTARAGQEAAVEGLAATADDYMTKPFAAPELLARVGAHLRLGKARREAEIRFTAMADLAPALIWVSDPDGGRVFVNAGWRRFTGRESAAELGAGWAGGLHPADRDTYRRTVDAAREAGRPWEVEYRLRREDGAYHWVVEQAVPLPDGAGQAVGWVGSCVDINARYREAERQRLLAEVGAELDGQPGVEDRLARLARLVVGSRLADRVVVRRVDPAGRIGEGTVAASDGGIAVSPVPSGEVSEAVRRTATSRRTTLRPSGGPPGAVHVPLALRDRTLAVMSLERHPGAPPWTDDDRELAEEIALRAALAVDNALLLAEERAAGERLALLQRATAELSAAATPTEVADVTVTHLAQLLGSAARLTVLEYDPSAQTLSPLAPRDTPDGRGSGLVAASVRAGGPLWLDGDRPGTSDRELQELVRADGLRGAVALPLVAAGRVVGGIGIGLEDRPSLSDSERTTVLALAEPCASALERARLYRAEHEIAQTLQRSLLPQQLPELGRLALAARYLPGAENTRAGGDWYDVVELDDGRVAIAVGDVVGQGTAAAAVMGQLRTALSGYLLAGDGPATALELLDRLTARIPGARASTALCMVLDPATGALRFSRAGHLPALVVDRDGPRYLDGPDGHGALLGVSTDRPPYTEGELVLAPGSTLVLYTDGLVERRGESLDEGLARLGAVAGDHAARDPESLATALLDDLAGPDDADDVALMIARLGPAPLALRLPARAEELAGMRRRVQQWTDAAGLDDDTAEDLQLAVGEAASNGVEHAYRASALSDGEPVVLLDVARRGDGAVAVEVRDHGTWRPVPTDPGFRGRGLTLIRALGEEVSITSGGTGGRGTAVRFLVRPAAPPAPGRRAVSVSPPPVGTPATLAVVEDGTGRVDLRGDLDVSGVHAVREELTALVDGADRALVLDLTGVGYLASAGVGLLLEVLERGRSRGLDVDLRAVDGPAARILDLVRVARP